MDSNWFLCGGLTFKNSRDQTGILANNNGRIEELDPLGEGHLRVYLRLAALTILLMHNEKMFCNRGERPRFERFWRTNHEHSHDSAFILALQVYAIFETLKALLWALILLLLINYMCLVSEL